MEIPDKYKIPIVGEYNASVYICPECRTELLEGKFGNVYRHIIGFADTNMGTMAVVECPKCFTKFYFHAMPNALDYFEEFIAEGLNPHFKSNE